ncbi:OsmC family peroxiredoxin [Frigoriflavimonas asaccharolytica]|uniref:Osmotically inducible protein OsmC n=1 Tax=Frigoriflavimonas asaccharolytica TaxID=2735899 RepID=A0A8J8G8C7_9FLAO|nr:OsmC family peroxiredoxin [Frigoriflavimonas asaccharolytica]NRS93191.1 osmotically inducible protein OsmC [Frigoriflavimonas asaccharolytica]
MKRTATAVWNGTIKEGKGNITTSSEVLNEAPYSYNSRFKDGPGTNPEELIASAHAGCFTMKVSADFAEAGFTPTKLETTCKVTLSDGKISKSTLILKANIEGISEEEFQKLVENSKETYPVNQALNMEIALDATLN